MKHYYLLTIDQSLVRTNPLHSQFIEILNELKEQYMMQSISPNQIISFELKNKGSKRKGTWRNDYPHLHTIVYTHCDDPFSLITPRKAGWNIQFKILNSIDDLARASGYIQKYMVNQISPVLQSNARSYALAPEPPTKDEFKEYAFDLD